MQDLVHVTLSLAGAGTYIAWNGYHRAAIGDPGCPFHSELTLEIARKYDMSGSKAEGEKRQLPQHLCMTDFMNRNDATLQ